MTPAQSAPAAEVSGSHPTDLKRTEAVLRGRETAVGVIADGSAPFDFIKARQAAIDAALPAVAATLPLLCGHGGVFEIRALRDGAIASGYYDAAHMDDAALASATLDAHGWNVFVTLNPCADGALARAANRIRQGRGKLVTTGDNDIARRSWLLVDLDPERPSGTSSSDLQWEASHAKASAIKKALASEGWPEPLWASSGNGAHLLYRVDLPNDKDSTELLKAVLSTLARRFDDPPETQSRVRVDTAVFNAARISTLYGTMKRKGDHTAEYPHRRSELFRPSANLPIVPVALLRATAGTGATTIAVPKASANDARVNVGDDGSGRQWLQDWLGRSGLTVVRETEKDGAHLWTLAECPFNPDHKDAAVIQGEHGYGYKCFHASCAQHDWHSLRVRVEGTEATTEPTRDATEAKGSVQAPAGENELKLQEALRCIRRDTPCEKHTASNMVGMALRHVDSAIPEPVGRFLCREWDIATGGTSSAKFESSDPNYRTTQPLTTKTVFKIARECGWTGSAKLAVTPRQFGFVHARELLKPVRVRWMIEHYIEANTSGLLFGASTAGKSFLAIDWACCVATGTPWVGNAVERGAVFIVAGEGHAGIGRRLRAWGLHHGVELESAPLFVSLIPAALINPISSAAVREAVQKLVEEHGQPALLIVDTLARNLGPGDESSAEDIGAYVGNLDVLRAELACTVLTVHHSGHGSQDRARGSSALKAAVDHEFRLEMNGEQRLLTCTKAKDAEPPPPLALDLKVLNLEGWALDGGDPPTSCVLVPSGAGGSAPMRQRTRLTGALRIAFDALRRVLADDGIEPPDEVKAELGLLHAPAKVVAEGPWRERCYKTGIAEGDQPAKQKAFSRARNKLRDLGYLGIWDGWFWTQLPC